jgi:hypothetical protein
MKQRTAKRITHRRAGKPVVAVGGKTDFAGESDIRYVGKKDQL